MSLGAEANRSSTQEQDRTSSRRAGVRIGCEGSVGEFMQSKLLLLVGDGQIRVTF